MSPRYLFLTAAFLLVLGAPVVAQEAAQEVRVTDFGARAERGRDNTEALRTALHYCRDRERATLVFPKGRYEFLAKGDSAAYVVATMTDFHHLTIDGQGSTLIFHGPSACFWARYCNDLAIKNLIIDWDRPPFAQGQVLSVAPDQKSFDIQVAPEYPVGSGDRIEALDEYDRHTGLPLPSGVTAAGVVASTTLVAEQQLRLQLNRPVAVQPGACLVLRHRVRGSNAFTLEGCAHVTLQNVSVFTAPGLGLLAERCTDLQLNSFQVMIRPGSRRLMSTTSAAARFCECKGSIILLRCLFQGMGEDGVNVYGRYCLVNKRLDSHAVEAVGDGTSPIELQPGEHVEFTSGDTLVPYAEAVVRSAAAEKPTGACRIEFEQELPLNLAGGSDLLTSASRIPKLQMTDCAVRNGLGRGLLIQTREALVEHNTFQHCSGPAIEVGCDAAGLTAVGTRDVVIRHNLCEDCNSGAVRGPGLISVAALLTGARYAPAGAHRSLFIEGNLLRDTDNAAIFLASVDGGVVHGNTLENCCRRPSMPASDAAITVIHARDVRVTANRYQSGRADRRFIAIGADCEGHGIEVRSNQQVGPGPASAALVPAGDTSPP